METVVVGKIGAPYGVRGWVKIHSFTEPGTNIFTYPLLMNKQEEMRHVVIEEYKQHGDAFVAKIASIDDRDQAALITNLQLLVLRENLPEINADEYYYADLLGLAVYNKEQVCLGQVVDFLATGANEVIVVHGEKEHLIPFVFDAYVLKIDVANKTMHVDWDAEF